MADDSKKKSPEKSDPAVGVAGPEAPATTPPKESPKAKEPDKAAVPPAPEKDGGAKADIPPAEKPKEEKAPKTQPDKGDKPKEPDKATVPPAPEKDSGAKADIPPAEKPREEKAPKSPPKKGDKPKESLKGKTDNGDKPKEPSQDKVVKFPGGDKEPPKADKGKGDNASQSPDTATQKPPRPVDQGKLVWLKLSEVHPFHTFRPHPFQVRKDAAMRDLAESIKATGVMTPGTVRPEKDGNGYEIIAGHRRTMASEMAGLEEMPFFVREMSDHEAVQEMRDSNKQRPEMLPTELAALLALEVEDIKHQGGRLEGVAEGDKGKRSVEIVGEAHGLNYKKVMRYIRLNSLIPEFKDLVDGLTPKAKKMGFMPAVELSFLTKKHQQMVLVSMEGEQVYPSLAQAQRLRELEKDGKLTGDIIDGILSEEKKDVDNVIINTAELNKYFGDTATPRQMKDQIIALLEDWKAKQPQEKGKPDKSAERS